jgi:hypothetical protein
MSPAGPKDVVVGHGPSMDDHMYYTVVGIGVERAEVTNYLNEVGVDTKAHKTFKAKVTLATVSGIEIWGNSLAEILDAGEVLGPNEEGTGFLVGEIESLIEAGTAPLGPDDAQLMDVVIENGTTWSPGERPQSGSGSGAATKERAKMATLASWRLTVLAPQTTACRTCTRDTGVTPPHRQRSKRKPQTSGQYSPFTS